MAELADAPDLGSGASDGVEVRPLSSVPKYKIFLDDIRDPPDSSWTVARSYDAAVALLEQGWPEMISFDHDLGEDRTGFDFAKYLVELDLDSGTMPVNFQFQVHSANPIGRQNIEGLLDGYIRWKANELIGSIPA